jgi:hypothetical protein
MLTAAGDARRLADNLNGIKAPPPINIGIGVYGTSAIASALLAGNGPLANAMGTANKYAGGGAYSSSGGHSVSGVSPKNREGGGPMKAGMPYRVGETGIETIVPMVDSYAVDSRTTKRVGNAPAVNIENYHEGSKPVGQIAAEIMFRARFA